MGKVLKIFVIIILILSGVSLFLANSLFQKRELLTKRNQILENTVVNLAATIEKDDAEAGTASPIDRDVGTITDRELINPERDSMLEDYLIQLEEQSLTTFNLNPDAMRRQLRSYYVLDAEGKYVLSGLNQLPVTTGKGSMNYLLDQVIARASAQQGNLNKTRQALTAMREDLASTVEELNTLKIASRADKREITEKAGQIATLEDEKATLENQVARLTQEKKELNAELADTRNEVDELTNTITGLEEELAAANATIEEWKNRWDGLQRKLEGQGDNTPIGLDLTAGIKGKIIEANDELKFAIIELTDEALAELLGPERENKLPLVDMNVSRPGRESASGEFVTRIKLRQLVHGKNLVVVDILSDWQQTAVVKGDVVFF